MGKVLIANYKTARKGNIIFRTILRGGRIQTLKLIPMTIGSFGPESTTSPVALASSSNGRTSGKPWKSRKSATVYAISPLQLTEDLTVM
jgi:hypothetical protein